MRRSLAPIDAAFKIAYALVKSWRTSPPWPSGTELSEADTRAKLIDPIFRDVLNWPEACIVREEPCAVGYVDYTLRRQASRLVLVEAKRESVDFNIQASASRHPALIGGPQVANKALQSAIKQVTNYGASQGCPYAVVTNGTTYVVFQTFDARPLEERFAFVFLDLTDRQQFRSFYNLLSFEAVTNGALQESFLALQQAKQNIVPLDMIDSPDREFKRNKLWSVMSHLATRVLEDHPETRLEIIQHCYVPTRGSQETDELLRELIGRPALPLLRESGSIEVRPTPQGRTSLGHALESDVKDRRPGVYVLTGGAGSGKTTFLSRFEHFIEPVLVSNWCAWFQVDFLAASKPDAGDESNQITAYVSRVIRDQVSRRYAAEVPTDGAALRELFSDELARLERTVLFGLPKDSQERLLEQNKEVDRLFTSDVAFVEAALRRLVRKSKRIVIVLDNSDQLGEEFQERVLLHSRALTNTFSAVCIVSLREEKFYAAYYRGVFNAFPTRKFHIGSPDFQTVLGRRLEYAIQLIRQQISSSLNQGTSPAEPGALSPADCLEVLRTVLYSVTRRNRAIARMIESVAGGNMRFGLELFRDFISSANTDVEKILRIGGGYIVPFHEFVRSIMLQNREFFRTGVSAVVSVFAKSSASHSSYFTGMRILGYLHDRHSAASRHGVGYVDMYQIRDEYKAAFGTPDDFDQTLGHLVRVGLVESEPPRMHDTSKIEAVKVAAAGYYYHRWLTRQFAYFDLVIYEMSYDDVQLANYLADVARSRDLETRTERVEKVLQFLIGAEAQELARVPVGNAFSAAVMTPIASEVRLQLRGLARMRPRQRHAATSS